MAMGLRKALMAHMKKGKGAHPDAAVKRMKAGGVTSAEMKKYGRNVARAMNQKSPTKPGKG